MKATCNCPLWTLQSVNKQNHCYEVPCRAAISCHQSHKRTLKLLIQILISLKTNPKVNKEKMESVVNGKLYTKDLNAAYNTMTITMPPV